MPRTGAFAVASLMLASVLLLACGCAAGGVPNDPQECHSLDQRFYVRGAVRNPDGSPAPGLKVSVVGKPGPGTVADLLCSGVGTTGPAGDYELSIHVHVETDHGREVLAEAWKGGSAVGSTRVRIDMRIGSPPDVERAASGVNIVVGSKAAPPDPVSGTGTIPQLAILAIIAVVVLIFIWDFRRVRKRRKQDAAGSRREKEKWRPPERKECEKCGARVRSDRMDAHLIRVHPRGK